MKKKFTTNLWFIYIMLAFYCSGTGCSKKDMNGGAEVAMVSKSDVKMSYPGGEEAVKFISDGKWTISSSASWITFLTPMEGNGNAIVKIKASANDGASTRNASLTISSNGTNKTITVQQEAKSISIAFKHPSILYTAQELLELKNTITSNSSASIKTTYNNLMARCNTALTYVTNPYTGTNPVDFIDASYTPASYSRDLAMAYWFTGDRKYALKSIELIKAWAIKCKGIKYVSDAGNGMYLTRAMYPMVCAYDMLVKENIMDQSTQEIIKDWFSIIYTEDMASIQLWDKNDYFDKQYFQNHLVAHSMGIMMLGFAIDNEAMVQYGLSSTSNPKNIQDLIAGCIFMPGDQPCLREDPKAPAPAKGEIYDRYRHKTGPLKGLQYTHLTQTLLTTSARMCHNNGIDLFAYTAPTGENLRYPFEYYSDFYRLMNSCIKSEFYCGETDRMTLAGDVPGMYELGLRYYPDSEPIKLLLNSGKFNRESAYMDLLGFTRFFSAPVNK